MGLKTLFRRLRRSAPPSVRTPAAEGGGRHLDLRIDSSLFSTVRAHVEDFSRGEEAGFLLCGLSRLDDRDVLLAREWLPVPDSAISRNSRGSVLSWSAKFNSDALASALDQNCTLVLVHSHGSARPSFSPDDRKKEKQLFAGLSILADPFPIGTLLLGDGDASGSFWLGGSPDGPRFRRLVVLGDHIEHWSAVDHPLARQSPRVRLDRQSVAIGPMADADLAAARIAVIGLSGGGSHVFQQLAHMGVGALMPIDDQLVDETNLGRLVGATTSDIDKTLKVDVAKRLAQGIDPAIAVDAVAARFPDPAVLEVLKSADLVVSCVDRFDVREGINAFCRRYLIPHVDIGIEILSAGERLASADGQVISSLPGQPCMRCWFLTDALLGAERKHRPPGYDANPDAQGDAQVVSMNGVLASEACNTVLDLITGYANGTRGARFWQYDGRIGELVSHPVAARRASCPACAEEGFGDPRV